MDPSKLQTICQVLIAVFLILTALATFGSFYFGNKVAEEKSKSLHSHISNVSSPEQVLRMNAVQKLSQVGAVVDSCNNVKGMRVRFYELKAPFETVCGYMADIPDLREVNFSSAGLRTPKTVEDITPLRALTNLVALDLSWLNIADISVLRNLKGLVILSLTGNQVSDLSPLSHLKHLQILYLDNNPVVDLLPLSDCTDLRILSITDTQVTDLQPLITLKRLQKLDICPVAVTDDYVPPPITDAEVERFCAARPDVEVIRPYRPRKDQ
jgi:Leucine-rich repeat (LRR) protein